MQPPDDLDPSHISPSAVESRNFGINHSAASAMDDWVEEVGRKWNMGERALFSARLCIAELVNNVIEHGRNRRDDDHIVIKLSRYDRELGIEFMDTRVPFDPSHPVTRAEDLRESIGGRGLLLIQAFAKDLGYECDGKYNHITLKIAAS